MAQNYGERRSVGFSKAIFFANLKIVFIVETLDWRCSDT